MDQNHGGRIDDYIHSSYQVNRDVMDKSLKKAGQELKKNSTMSYVVKLGPGRERLPLNVNKYVPRDPRANATGGGSLFKPSVVGHGGKDPYWIEYEEIIENKKTKTKYEGLFEEKKNYMYNTPLELSMKNVIYYVRKNRVDLLTYMKFTICHVDKGPNNPALECEISMGFENAAEAKEFRKGKFHRLGGNELTVTNITVSKNAEAWKRPQIRQHIEDQRPGVPGIFLVRGLEPSSDQGFIREKLRESLKSVGLKKDFTVEMLYHNEKFRGVILLHFSSDLAVAVKTNNKKQQEEDAEINKKIQKELKYQLFKDY